MPKTIPEIKFVSGTEKLKHSLDHVYILGTTGNGKTHFITHHLNNPECFIAMIETSVDAGREEKILPKIKHPENIIITATETLSETEEAFRIADKILIEKPFKYKILSLETGAGLYKQIVNSYIEETREKKKYEQQVKDRRMVISGKITKSDGTKAYHKSLLDPQRDYGIINQKFLNLLTTLKIRAIKHNYNLWITFPLVIKEREKENPNNPKKPIKYSELAPNIGDSSWSSISALPDYIFNFSVEEQRGKNYSMTYTLYCQKNASGDRFTMDNPSPTKVWNKIRGVKDENKT